MKTLDTTAIIIRFETRCFEGVARVSQGYLFEVSRVFQRSFKDISRKL